MRFALGLVALFAVGILATPASAQRSPRPSAESQLQAEIERLAALSQGVVGLSAIDLSTGRSIEFNADQRFKMASTFKLLVAAHAFHLADQGRLSLTQTYPMARQDMLEPGVLNEYFRHPGLAISTLNAIELSITRSDNGATDFVFERVGGPVAVNAWLGAAGFSDIDMGSRTIRQTFTPEPGATVSEELERTATPSAMVRFLTALDRRAILSPASTDALMDILSRTIGDRIALHLPAGTRVLHKTGTLFSPQGISVNDIGFIHTPDGRKFAIAIYIKQSPEAVSHATRDAVIGHISRLVYDHFLLAEGPPRRRP